MKRPPAFDRAFGPFDYAGPVGEIIRRGKYGGRPDALPLVAAILTSAVPPPLLDDPPEIVVPVPLRLRRVVRYGVDPPLLLARAVARVLLRPCPARWARRVRATSVQAGLDEAARRRNVSGAFHASERLRGMDVLVIDDVRTTGATTDAMAKALKGVGVVRVRVLTAAIVERW